MSRWTASDAHTAAPRRKTALNRARRNGHTWSSAGAVLSQCARTSRRCSRGGGCATRTCRWEFSSVRRCKLTSVNQVDPVLKAPGFNSLKVQCFQEIGFKYHPSPLHFGQLLGYVALSTWYGQVQARPLLESNTHKSESNRFQTLILKRIVV